MKAFVSVKSVDLEQPGEVQAKDENYKAADDRELFVISMCDLANRSCDRPQRNEDQAKPENECQRIEQDGAEQFFVGFLKGFDTGAGD